MMQDPLSGLIYCASEEGSVGTSGAEAAVERSQSPGRRSRRYALQGGKWSRANLTWTIARWPSNIDPHMIRSELSRALSLWASVSRLTFKEVRRTSEADIVISFLSGPHGDDYAFDGPGNILAHAFFPMKGVSLGGDAHFDADEKWIANSLLVHPEPEGENHLSSGGGQQRGVSLFAVAAHEFGHSLGLAHSAVSGALMFPYYQAMKDDFSLPHDDTAAIQLLYGAKAGTEVPAASPQPPPSSPKPTQPRVTSPPTWTPGDEDMRGDRKMPVTCNTSFDAVSSIRNEVFFFKGRVSSSC